MKSLLSVTLLLILPTMASGKEPDFNPIVVIDHAFPVIRNARTVSAEKARLRDDELVMGVRIKDEARAYPINMLTGPQREIINDVLGRLPIAATW